MLLFEIINQRKLIFTIHVEDTFSSAKLGGKIFFAVECINYDSVFGPYIFYWNCWRLSQDGSIMTVCFRLFRIPSQITRWMTLLFSDRNNIYQEIFQLSNTHKLFIFVSMQHSIISFKRRRCIQITLPLLFWLKWLKRSNFLQMWKCYSDIWNVI